MAQRSYAILASNDGSGNFTLSVKYNATLSGGTALPGGGSDLVSAVNTTSLATALEIGQLVSLNDRSANA
jgi:hypothetical protein